LKHRAVPSFWQYFGRLPPEEQERARRNFQRLRRAPDHPSLRFKRVGRFWSARCGKDYRALAVRKGDELRWFWIGPHATYDKRLSRS
jgi:hypothetical protein